MTRIRLHNAFGCGTLLILLSIQCFALSTSIGSIRGVVVNEKGRAIPNAKVNVVPVGKMLATPIRFVETDKAGRFSIGQLELGEYRVFAQKEEAGYPNANLAFYSNNIFQVARLTARTPTATVIIHVGPKAGTVSGRVSDALTGTPILARIRLARVESGLWMTIAADGNYEVAVPANTEVSMDVSAEGYKKWVYQSKSGVSAFKLAPQQNKSIDIQMKQIDK